MQKSIPFETLLQSLKDSNPIVRQRIVVELGQWGEPAVPALISLLEVENDRAVRVATIQTLGQLNDHRASEVLTECMLEADLDLRQAARKALLNLY